MFGINPEKKNEMQKVVRVKPSDSSAFTFQLVSPKCVMLFPPVLKEMLLLIYL